MSWSLPRESFRPQRPSRSSEGRSRRPDFCTASLNAGGAIASRRLGGPRWDKEPRLKLAVQKSGRLTDPRSICWAAVA